MILCLSLLSFVVLSRLISVATLGIYQTAIKKLSFNKIIAFIFLSYSKTSNHHAVIYTLHRHLFHTVHLTMLKVTSTTTTVLSQDRWLHCGHSGPPLKFLFFFFKSIHSLFRENNHLEFPHTFYFFPLFFVLVFLFIF